MRITIEIPHALHLALKAKAKEENCSMRDLILRAVQAQLHSPRMKFPRRDKLPLIHSKRPGTLKLDNNKIYKLISFP